MMTRKTALIFSLAFVLLFMIAAIADGQDVGFTLLGSPANGDTASVKVAAWVLQIR